jgi:Transposase
MKKPHILTDPPRRRRFTIEQKSDILAKLAEGVTVAEAARSNEVSPSLIYFWLRQAKKDASFVRLVPNFSPPPNAYPSSSLPPARVCLPSGIVIEFASAISLDDIINIAARLGGRP